MPNVGQCCLLQAIDRTVVIAANCTRAHCHPSPSLSLALSLSLRPLVLMSLHHRRGANLRQS